MNEPLEGHVVLDVECLDRIYLNVYVPKLQVSGQVVGFMTRHLGLPIPSPAVMEKIGTAFRRAVNTFAAAHRVPIVKFGKLDRKAEVMQPYLRRQAPIGIIPGVAAIGVAQSTLTEDGRRSPALRFGDPRVMALLGALCVSLNALGFTNRSLRAQVSQLLGVDYTTHQMSYDLARLRSKGLIRRRPRSNTYQLTPDGQRVAIFYTKVHDRLLRPLIAADQPPAPADLRRALKTIDRHVAAYVDNARLPNAA